jgi:heme-degrading monooxygenase HmoA
MAEVYSSGAWKAKPGEEEEFVRAWTEFAKWVSDQSGAGPVRLTRDLADPGRFLSFAPWESMEAMQDWKASPEFKEHMGQVQAHVAEFAPSELELVAKLEEGTAAEV